VKENTIEQQLENFSKFSLSEKEKIFILGWITMM
jgi:hypothetical protein